MSETSEPSERPERVQPVLTREQYEAKFGETDDAAPGWDAINARFDPIYPDQPSPLHWGVYPPMILGGTEPLHGVSAYRCFEGPIDHLHFLTYGYTDLWYEPEAVGGDYSKFGFEMTFRLRHDSLESVEHDDVVWAVNMLQNIAKYVFKSGNYFEHGHYMPANSPIRLESDTTLTAFVFINDPIAKPIGTHHGRVDFIQAIGITQAEYESIRDGSVSRFDLIDRLLEGNPLGVTDLDRRD